MCRCKFNLRVKVLLSRFVKTDTVSQYKYNKLKRGNSLNRPPNSILFQISVNLLYKPMPIITVAGITVYHDE